MTEVLVYYIIHICNTTKQSLKKHIKVKEKVVKEVQWTNQRKGVLNHIVPKEDNINEQADRKELTECYKKLAEATKQVGNLKVQNADYSQIVGDLSNKIKQYENKYGGVFTKGSSNKTE